MADATYNAPITRNPKVGLLLDGIEINRRNGSAMVWLSEVDDGGTVVNTVRISLTEGSPAANAIIRDFAGAIINDATNPLAKLNRRVLQFLADKGYVAGITVV